MNDKSNYMLDIVKHPKFHTYLEEIRTISAVCSFIVQFSVLLLTLYHLGFLF